MFSLEAALGAVGDSGVRFRCSTLSSCTVVTPPTRGLLSDRDSLVFPPLLLSVTAVSDDVESTSPRVSALSRCSVSADP